MSTSTNPKQQTPREHPILFSAPLVRAILDGRKTQTRRIASTDAKTTAIFRVENESTFPPAKEPYTGWVRRCDAPLLLPVRCPVGAPGDRLWVRETWQAIWATEDPPPTLKSPEGWNIGYPATDGIQEMHDEEKPDGISTACRPSIFMPRWASRIDLEVTGVRVERVQEISEEDAVAEGLTPWTRRDGTKETARYQFRCLWDQINGDRAPWTANPWVWAIEFRRIRP